jgi:tetratricopeptide (TPR) repeat protein
MTNLAIGELQGKKEYIERAAAYFSQAGEACGPLSPQLLSDWGIVLMKLGEMSHDKTHVEQAAAKFEEAINQRMELQEGEDVELEWLYNYGCAMDFLGDFHDEPIYYEKAVQVLAHVLKHDPEYIHARYNLALALTHLGELNCDIDCFHQSIEHLQIVLENDTEDELAWNDLGMAFLNLAVLTNDEVQKDNTQFYFAQAEQKLLHAITLGSLPALYNLACAYALTGRKDDSIHFLEKAEHADALPYTDDVIHDEWLDNLRDHKAYRMFISRLLNKQDQNDDSNFDN